MQQRLCHCRRREEGGEEEEGRGGRGGEGRREGGRDKHVMGRGRSCQTTYSKCY